METLITDVQVTNDEINFFGDINHCEVSGYQDYQECNPPRYRIEGRLTNKERNKVSKLKKIPTQLRKVLNENQKLFYKLGWIDNELSITEEGYEELDNFLLEKYSSEMAKIAKERVEDIKSCKEDC